MPHLSANFPDPPSSSSFLCSIHAIVDQLLPLVTNKNVTKVINDLPKGIRLIAAIIDTLSVTSVQNLLEDGFPLRQALRPSGWQRVQRELDRLEATVVPISDLDLVTSAGTLEVCLLILVTGR